MVCMDYLKLLTFMLTDTFSVVPGHPGSGYSTLLKTPANQRKEFHSVKGDVYYNSLTPAQIAKHYRGDIRYDPEDDIYFPMLTLGQTVLFAAKRRSPQICIPGMSRTDYIQKVKTIFGLNNTPVWDASIRGVSGGEKKRVS
jgi:ATP-binding cassette subfamily G (WHITE) protein 2 (SNQ2)